MRLSGYVGFPLESIKKCNIYIYNRLELGVEFSILEG